MMTFDLTTLITLLLIIGAINWGFIAYNNNDIVTQLTVMAGYPIMDRYVKMCVGLAGVFALYLYVQQQM